jgi:2'-5' RNA ligase
MAEASATRRLFFALWPDETCRAALAHVTRKAARASGGRPVAVSNLHSTLAFLGAVKEAQFATVAQVGAQVRQASFRLVLDRLEHWPKQGVLCLTSTEPPPASAELAAGLWKLLAVQGFVPDSKPYRPHVTVARKVVKPHALGAIHPVEWRVEDFALVESVTAPEGAQYTPLQHWPLRG